MRSDAAARRTLDIAPAAFVKVLAAVVLVWAWLRLWRFVMVFVVAVVLAIALSPVVAWLERRRVPRALGAALTVLALAGIVVGFFVLCGSSLAGEARMLGGRIETVQQRVVDRLPPLVRDVVSRSGTGPEASSVADYAVGAGRLLTRVIVGGAIALILVMYLLVDGRRTYEWLAAYAPREHRGRVHVTAVQARASILNYVSGNAATALFAATFVFVSLSLLQVPAALLLALLAGLFDFVPVLGFIGSGVPAVLLALTRSPSVALAVCGLYVTYHFIENYYIGPKVYGDRLRLSSLAVVVAFAIGAELGGVVGAILALPIAAMYPVVERVWLADYLSADAVETHQRLEHRAAR